MSNTVQYGNTPDDTLISPSSKATGNVAVPTPSPEVPGGRRSTVLPRVEWAGDQPNVVPFQRERFEELGTLGEGGMGEVVLLKDHDIQRTVALKRLPAGSGSDFVYRFVEEIRTVGQLDHPNIVPVHDVGIDEAGRYYFVMKHLQGQTLETIIEKLRAGDRETHERFTFKARLQLFQAVLNAVGYAHKKGIIHRDLKPSNIMVGPFGEVTVMDWGLARQLGQSTEKVMAQEPGAATLSLRDAAMLRTQMGAVMGTPLYMSPEQARGRHDIVGERSDIYSLGVVLHELLYLRHYLEGRASLGEILKGVENVTPNFLDLGGSPHQPAVPSEYAWFLPKFFKKDPLERYASIDEMLAQLQDIQEGRFHVHCQRTAIKRGLYEMLRVVDGNPMGIMIGSTLVGGGLLFTIGYTVVHLLR